MLVLLDWSLKMKKTGRIDLARKLVMARQAPDGCILAKPKKFSA
jgi:hypothetical protein